MNHLYNTLPLVFLSLALSSNAQLLIVSNSDFNSDGAWSIDIDGDGVDELAASTTANKVLATRDRLTTNSTWITFGNGIGRALFPSSPITGLDGTFTAAESFSIDADNLTTDSNWENSASLWHGTYTSDISDAVSLIGWLIESPTTGSDLGFASGINHNDDYYIYSHNFGVVEGGADFTVNYSTDILNVSAVPEPSSYAAILGGLTLGMVGLRRRRRGAL